jgi:hypothetical protein
MTAVGTSMPAAQSCDVKSGTAWMADSAVARLVRRICARAQSQVCGSGTPPIRLEPRFSAPTVWYIGFHHIVAS